MLRWALAFFIISIIAGLFGFGDIAAGTAEIARVLFYVFIVLFVLSLVYYLVTGRRPPPPPPAL